MKKKKSSAFHQELVGDDLNMINMCLNCPFPRCVNCIDSKGKRSTPSGERTTRQNHGGRPKKGLSGVEKVVLQYYVTSKDDDDIASHSKYHPHSVCQARIRLGLPVLRRTPIPIREQLVAEVKERMNKLYGIQA